MINAQLQEGRSTQQRNTAVVLFFAGVLAFIIGQIFSEIYSPSRAQLLQSAAILPILWFGRKLLIFKTERDYFWTMFLLLMLSNAFIIVRVGHINYVFIKDYLFADFRFWPYLIPFAAFFVTRSFPFRKIFDFIYWIGLIFIVISVACWQIYKATPGIAEQCIWAFSSLSGFVLLTAPYHSTKRLLVAGAAVLLALYISTMLARRNIMLTNINFLVFSYILFLFFSRGQATKKVLSIYCCAVVIAGGFYFFQQQKNSSFKLIANRAKDDSRDYVFTQYFAGMENNMWFGKGIEGNYFCPLVTDDPTVEAVEYRDLIECGYLQVILKGGYVNLALLLAILLPAVFLGLFQSRNMFTKGCALIILLWLIDMGPYGLPNLSLRYTLVWICVGVCFNKSIRFAGETEIKETLLAFKPVDATKQNFSA